mmetsp:Transcript_5839/g.20356  ORF Transcript_5839/g.20356 Transcript_5839/m.20356 type:complete len:184 (-) Transcript_5839:778-1329(-)
MSEACQEFFIAEQCLYECDVNAGKYRFHGRENGTECTEENAWTMSGMPIKASFADAWYEACKDDLFHNEPSGSYFAVATVADPALECDKISSIYTDGKDMIERMWAGAFTYSTDEDNSYTMMFEEGEENPNDKVSPPGSSFPAQCDFHEFDKEEQEACEEAFSSSALRAALGLAVAAAFAAML